jgi:DNA invertase Pin-like site-specific DNA recombinase
MFPITYFLYARKSLDDKDRQVLSVAAQIREVTAFAKGRGLKIERVFQENRTARKPGRPVFNEMMKLIRKGKAKGILAWHPDRISRNEEDASAIKCLLASGELQDLQFPSFTYEKTATGTLLLGMMFEHSKYYSNKLSEDTKRGQREKVLRGVLPSTAPIGYLNDKFNKTIVPDHERFNLVKSLFEQYASGRYTLEMLANYAREVGLRGAPKRRRRTEADLQESVEQTSAPIARELTTGNIQKILENPFYYGSFRYNGLLHPGSHQPMISKAIFDRCTAVRESRSIKVFENPPPAFRNLFRCGECGCWITSQVQKGHIYYSCTKKKGACSQRYVRHDDLSKMCSEILARTGIPEECKEHLLEGLEKQKEIEFSHRDMQIREAERKLTNISTQQNALIDLRLRGILQEDDFARKHNQLHEERVNLAQLATQIRQNTTTWLELATSAILDCHRATILAFNGIDSEKAEFLKKIGSNHRIWNKTILVELHPLWKCVENKELFTIVAPSTSSHHLQNSSQKSKMTYTVHLSGVARTLLQSSVIPSENLAR